jgi:hypothetical protein
MINKLKSIESYKFLILLTILYLPLQLITGLNYPLFRDELYYLTSTSHLSFGYVDHPPLSIFLLTVWKFIFGSSQISVRILPALCGAAVIWITALTTKEMGGSKVPQMLAALCAFLAASWLSMCSYYSMNSYDLVFWSLLFLILIKILNTGDNKLWINFGIIAGIALLNKISILFLLFSVFAGMLIFRRDQFTSNKFWFGYILAGIIFLPYVIWQFFNNFATLEFIRNASAYKISNTSIVGFYNKQVFAFSLFISVIWLAGLFTMLLSNQLRKYRVISVIYIIILAILLIQKSKPYYLYVIYSPLIAAGSIMFCKYVYERKKYLFNIFIVLLAAMALVTMPVAIPVLSPQDYVKYSEASGIKPDVGENRQQSILPQFFADRFGWRELTEKVVSAYNTLTQEEKNHCAIYGQNYGEAGAVDYYGKEYGLPPAISGHNSYWFWGYGGDSVNVVIVVGGDENKAKELFEEVTLFAIHSHPLAMPDENNIPIYIARKPKIPMKEIWNMVRFYI